VSNAREVGLLASGFPSHQQHEILLAAGGEASFFATFPPSQGRQWSRAQRRGERSGATGYSGASASALHRFPRLCAVHA